MLCFMNKLKSLIICLVLSLIIITSCKSKMEKKWLIQNRNDKVTNKTKSINTPNVPSKQSNKDKRPNVETEIAPEDYTDKWYIHGKRNA